MSQEFQRIANQLYQLQLSILKSQLPILLITFIQNHDQDLQLSIEQLTNNLMSAMKKQLINMIAQNIVNVKGQNNRMRVQNQQLKELIRKQSGDMASIKITIDQVMKQKNNLSFELAQLKTQQISLGKLINSSSIQTKIKQILKDNENIKKQSVLFKQELKVKEQQLKQLKQKEIFYCSEIKALQNDNNLFHQDLTKSNNQIKLLQQTRHSLLINQSKIKKQIEQLHLSYKSQIQIIKKQLDIQHQSRTSIQESLQEYQTQSNKLSQQKQKQMQRYVNVCEQNKYMRQSLQDLQEQLGNRKQQQQKLLQKLLQFQNYINQLTQKTDFQQKQYNQQLTKIEQQKDNQIQQYKHKLEQIQKQQQCSRMKIREMEDAHSQQILRCNRDKQKLIQEHLIQFSVLNRDKQFMTQELQNNINKLSQRLEQEIKNSKQNTEKYELLLQIQKQNTQYYKIYLQQNNQLKAQLERITQARSQNNYLSAHKKYLFQCMQIKESVRRLVKQNNQLRVIINAIVQANNRWVNKQINRLVCYVMERKIQCESCLHWQKYQSSKRSIKDNKTKGNGQIRSNKDLKALNQKFKLIKEQNQKFGNRIQQIIHD